MAPTAKITTVQIPLRPVDDVLAPLGPERDVFPGNRDVHRLELTYKLKVEEPGAHKPTLPMLNKSCPAQIEFFQTPTPPAPHAVLPISISSCLFDNKS